MSKVHRHPSAAKPKPLTMSKALKDGVVTGAEAKRIAATYSHAGDLKHASTRNKLASYFEAHVDDFQPAAQKKLAHVLRASEPHTAEPGATADSEVGGIAGYREARGSLFVNGVSVGDFLQGNLGDCYFLSSVNSIIHQDPKAIQNLFHANRDGTVTVTFQGRTTPDGPVQSIPITVDRRVAVNAAGNDVYTHSRNAKEIWPEILEKAYASFRTQYPCNSSDPTGSGMNAIGEAGYASDAFAALTGRSAQSVSTQSSSPEDVWNALVANTGIRNPTTASSNASVESGLVHDHVYSVLGTTVENGVPEVILHNPWGEQEVGNDGHNDGTFKLPLDQFMANFGWFTTLD